LLWIDYGANQEPSPVTVTAVNSNVPPYAITVNKLTLPHAAFFPIHPVSQVQFEGLDADGLSSRRAFDHVLHLPSSCEANRQENFFTAHLPSVIRLPQPPYAVAAVTNPFFALQPDGSPNPYYTPTTFFDQAVDGRFQDPVPPPFPGLGGYKTQWAEIAYFLWPNGTTTPNGTPLYALYRAEFKVVPDNRYVNGTIYNLSPADHLPSPLPTAGIPIHRGMVLTR